MTQPNANTKKREVLLEHFRNDFPSFCKYTLKIRDKKKNLVPFILNKPQMWLWHNKIAPAIEGWRNGTKKDPLYIAILKARQRGFSTLIQAIGYWLATLWKFQEELSVCYDTDAVSNLFRMQKCFYTFSPIRPMASKDNRNEFMFANPDATAENAGLQSRISIDTADNLNLGRSYTYSFVHLSEFAMFEQINDPKELMLGLNQAIPEEPWTFVFMETTAKGEGYFKDLWFDDESRWDNVFVSWLVDEECRLDSTPFSLSTIEDSHYGDEENEGDKIRKQLVVWFPTEAQNMEWLDHETTCRLAWRRWAIDKKCEKDKNGFRQEYPTTENDAFISGGLGVFDQRLLADLRELEKNEQKTNPPQRFRFLPERFTGSQWWTEAWKSAPYGHLEVFEDPQLDRAYVVTGDPSEGLEKSDDAGCSVWRLPEMIEVATFDDTVDPERFAYVMYSLSHIYNNALIIHEVNNHGHASTIVLQKLAARLYWREVFDDARKRRELRTGWKTTVVTKPIMINALRTAISEGHIQPRSLRTIDQLKSYQKKVVRNKGGITVEQNAQYGAPSGKQDGLVIAAALAIQGALHPSAHHVPKKVEEQMIRMTADWWGEFADNPNMEEIPLVQ